MRNNHKTFLIISIILLSTSLGAANSNSNETIGFDTQIMNLHAEEQTQLTAIVRTMENTTFEGDMNIYFVINNETIMDESFPYSLETNSSEMDSAMLPDPNEEGTHELTLTLTHGNGTQVFRQEYEYSLPEDDGEQMMRTSGADPVEGLSSLEGQEIHVEPRSEPTYVPFVNSIVSFIKGILPI